MAKERARGTTLTVDGDLVGQVISLSGPSVSAETIDVSELSDSWRSFLAGINDGGEISATVHYDVSTHSGITDLFDSQLENDPVTCELAFVSGNALSGAVVLTGLSVESMEINGAVTATITWKYSGPINGLRLSRPGCR